METVLCEASAFYYYRVPPCILKLCLDCPDLSTRGGRRALSACDAFLGYIPTPLHVRVRHARERHDVNAFVTHVWNAEFEAGMLQEIDAYHFVTSPAMTLLLMARYLSLPHLVMAMYEMTGTFSVIGLVPEHREEVQRWINSGWRGEDGWSPVLDRNNKLTGLWKRKPLVSLADLRSFATAHSGIRGVKQFRRALDLVYGEAASPFEAQSAILLGWSRRLGGAGLGPFSLNRVVRFDRRAKTLSSQGYAVVDLYIEEGPDHSAIALECQGKASHGESGANEHDADRQLALESMGIHTILLTSGQIYSASRFLRLAEHVSELLGTTYQAKCRSHRDKERWLRGEVLINWKDLADDAQRAAITRRRRGR